MENFYTSILPQELNRLKSQKPEAFSSGIYHSKKITKNLITTIL